LQTTYICSVLFVFPNHTTIASSHCFVSCPKLVFPFLHHDSLLCSEVVGSRLSRNVGRYATSCMTPASVLLRLTLNHK
jgi:hypothetical protein